ncbi:MULTISPECIES: dipeptidase [Paenibacillus]|uniref:dipeptidase n=1 Tax=Paenibacillus TaxID=44249 RepID=UPI0022B8B59E|nr:membrane dipeptidase [Paenibacillus caseinilyticus]MCZ8519974.1 membrane dipeptidase [Paenibacillus caseinilyticus]
MNSPIIDGHCDVLFKLYNNAGIDFYNPLESRLDVTYDRLRGSNVKLQFFAIYLPERITEARFDHYLEYIDLFHSRIECPGKVRLVRSQRDLDEVMAGSETGAVLTLEGADALHASPLYTRILFHLGVRLIGPTWNYGNWAADGILEPRRGGFSRKGKSFIKECGDLGILLDASHLSVASFWDLAAHSSGPFVATHSNAKAVCGHPRNLDDLQIEELIRRDGRIGMTFVPYFVGSGASASIGGILKHIEHICSMGGVEKIVLGSDFDGIAEWIPGLEHAGHYHRLEAELRKHYSDAQVNGFLSRNWYTLLHRHLPVS